MVEVLLVRTSEDGASHTIFWDRLRYDWPCDLLGWVDDVPVASAAALWRYRVDYASIRRAAGA
jgi:hypothetical protein